MPRFDEVVARLRRRAHDDHGFTLIELLAVISIVGVVVGGIALATIVGLRTTSDTTIRLAESHDAQIASAYLANDVQNAVQVSGTACGGAGLTNLVSFAWPDGDTVSYHYGMVGGERQVVRDACGSENDRVVLGHRVGAGTPVVTCDGGGCGAGQRPNRVRIEIAEESGFAFALTGARRSYSGAGDPPPPVLVDAEFIALGQGPDALEINGTAGLRVLGDLRIFSNHPNAVRLVGNAELEATGTFQIRTGGGCNGCDAGNTSPFPPGVYTGSTADPLAGVLTPDGTGMPVFSTGNNNRGPGIYKNELRINSTETLAPGVYVLERGIDVSGNLTGSGVLLFNGCARNVACGGGNGSIRLRGNGTLNLGAPTTGPFTGMLVFQTNSQEMTFRGGSSFQTTGLIYSRSPANLDLATGNAGMRIGAVVGATMKISGTGMVVAGP